MAEESVESNGCSTEKVFEDKLSLPGTESGVSPEDRSVSSDSFHDGSMPRRNSTGKPSPKAAKEKIVPRYLRASTGSCHDFCKYGRKDALDEEEVRPWRKKNHKAQSSKQKGFVYIPLEEGKKATVEKEPVLPLRTQDTVVTAPLGEGKKSMELERRTQNPPKVRVQMASPDRKQSPAISALSGEKKKTMVDKKAASTDRQKSPAIITPSGEKKKAGMHMQMASPDRKLRPTVAALSGEKKKAGMHVQMASPDRKLRPTMAGLSGEKQKATVLKKMVSSAMAGLSGEKQKATVHKQMASSAMAVSSGEKKKATIKQFTSPVRTSISLKPKLEDHSETIKREVLFPSKNAGASLKDPSLHWNSKVEKQVNKSSSKRSPQDSLIKKLSSLRSLRSAEKPEKAGKTKTPISSPDAGVSESERSKRRDNITSDKNRSAAKPAAKNVQVHPIGSSSPSVTKKKAESLNLVVDQNSVQKAKMGKSEIDNIPEKTLHVVLTESISILPEPAADNEGVPPLPSEEDAETEGEGEFESDDEVEGEFDDTDSFDEDDDEHAYEEEVDEIVSDQKGTAGNNVVQGSTRKGQRKGWVMSESKDLTPVKVKFRRGRIVDLQSDSNANAPRRLRFRQRRIIDVKHSDHLSESRNRSKKEVDGNGYGDAAHPDNVKVVLRHQDAQEKKDEQGLFNNVIEETASKLVESRKSKVKALVGAFETVISLQDTKPSSQTVS